MKKLMLGVLLVICVGCSQQLTEEIVQTAIAETAMAEGGGDLSIAPTATSLPKNTPLPKPTRIPYTPTPRLPDCDDEVAFNDHWPTIYCDNFDDNRNAWESSDVDTLATSIYAVEDGKLVVDFSGKATSGYTSGVVQWQRFTEAGDFTLSVKGRIFSNYENATWGVNFREDNGDFYSLMISNNGGYWVDRLVGGRWDQIIPFRKHNAIKWDEENQLVLVADGEEMTIYVNEKLVDTFTSSAVQGDVISVALWTAEGVTARFEFDDLVVKEKP